MASWKEVLDEVAATGSQYDVIRRRYVADLARLTNRNVIVYYSGWLQKGQLLEQHPDPFLVNDIDKNGFMATIHGLDRTKGLDLLLHTPGGGIAAAESLVSYLRSMFGTNIRAVVPQIAMSAGTMIACACREIVLGKHSSLGPIDPQMGNLPAHAIVEEFERAAEEIANNPATIPLWQPIIAKYYPTLIGECQKAIAWSQDIVREWLISGMFADYKTAERRASRIVKELGDHALTLSHSRHYDLDAAKTLGLRVVPLERDHRFQDAVLTVHHACIHTLSSTGAVKIIENQNGISFVQSASVAMFVPGQ